MVKLLAANPFIHPVIRGDTNAFPFTEYISLVTHTPVQLFICLGSISRQNNQIVNVETKMPGKFYYL